MKLPRWCAVAMLMLSLAFLPAIASPATAGDSHKSQASAARIRIDNFGRVNANYYRGAQPKGDDYAALATLGIKTIINLTSDDTLADEPQMVQRGGMAYFQIPMTTHVAPTLAQMTDFLRIVTDPTKQPVYVHCVGGRHRTGVMTAVYRITQEGWLPVQAFKEMKQYKFGADFLHREFKAFVLGFQPDALKATPNPPGPHLTPAR